MSSRKQYQRSSVPDYKRLFQRPPMVASKDFSVWINTNDKNVVRFGVIVAKKNVKLAVNRNRSKRLAREIFKRFRDRFHNKDVVLIIKRFDVSTTNLLIWKKKLLGIYQWLEHFMLK